MHIGLELLNKCSYILDKYKDLKKLIIDLKWCTMKQDYYRPSTKLREGNVFTGVCHSVHKAGSASSPTGTLPLWDHTSQDHPPDHPHLDHTPPGTVSPWIKPPGTIPLGPHLFPEPYLPLDHTPPP